MTTQQKKPTKPSKEQAEFLAWLARQPDANPDAKVTFKPEEPGEPRNRVTILIPGDKVQPQVYKYRRKGNGYVLDVCYEESSQEMVETGELVKMDGRHKQSTKTTLPDAIASSVSPSELKKTLKKAGLSLSKQQLEIVRGKKNRAPVRERMAATGLKRSTLYHKSARLAAEVEAIRTKPLPPTPSKETPPTKAKSKRDYKNLSEADVKALTTRAFPPGPVFLCDVDKTGRDLRELDEEAALFVRADPDYYPGLKLQLDQHWTGTPAGKLIHLVRWCPRALLDKYDGPELVKRLVELLEAAKYGDEGERAAAWKELKILTKPGRGRSGRREFDTFTLGRIAEGYHCRVAYFQRKWKATASKPGYTTAAALEEIRNEHREELARFTNDKHLLSFLRYDPLEAACALAAWATATVTTAIDPKTFKRAFAAWRREQERMYEFEIHKREILNRLYAPSTPPKT